MPRLPVLLLIVATTAACSAPPSPTPTGPDTGNRPALFYAKDGAIYISDPAGAPARKITDGPADTEPAPSPDGKRVAFVRKVSRDAGGGELWVLDMAGDSAPRRLVDPAALVPTFGDEPSKSTVSAPRWSPAGDRVAFLKAGGNGGFLLTASADNGKVEAPSAPLYADRHYQWAPDGKHIAWVGGRMDVSPVDVSVLGVGGASKPVATGTNASSVAYADGGRSLVFANGDATGSAFATTPFTLRGGGVYSVEPPAAPRPLFSGTGSYDDVAALWRGAVAFTEFSADQRTKSIQVVPAGGAPHQLAETRSDAPGPEWVGQTVAYIGTEGDRPLMVTTEPDRDGAKQEPQRIDLGVESFAWGE